MFTEELVFLDEELFTSEEVIAFSYRHLKELDYVKEEYLGSILAREKEFPTGLMTHVGIHIAMPHTEAEFAKKEAIVFIRTKDEVGFQHMVDPEEEVNTRLIFNIVVKEPDHQVIFLTKLMKLFQNKELLERLLIETSPHIIVTLLKSFIKEQS